MTIDIVNPPARTNLELFQRWQNFMLSKFLTSPMADRTIIDIDDDPAETVAEIEAREREDWGISAQEARDAAAEDDYQQEEA